MVNVGNGNGTFQAPRPLVTGNQPSSVAVGDFNNNNKLDLAVANATSPGTVSVLLGNGDGTFQAQRQFAVGNAPGSVAIGDVNGDNLLDLAVANFRDVVSF